MNMIKFRTSFYAHELPALTAAADNISGLGVIKITVTKIRELIGPKSRWFTEIVIECPAEVGPDLPLISLLQLGMITGARFMATKEPGEQYQHFAVAMAETTSDYRIVISPEGMTGILCTICNNTSWNPNDVQVKYCAACNKFHH